MDRCKIIGFFPAMTMVFVLGGCGSNSEPALIADKPNTPTRMKTDIEAVQSNPALSEEEKRGAIARISGQKEATEQAEIQAIMSSTKTTPEEKKVELEFLRARKN